MKIRSHIFFLNYSIEKCSQMRGFVCFQTAKAALERVVTNEEHSNEFWNYYQILHLIATTEWHKNVGAHIFELQAAVCKSRNPI